MSERQLQRYRLYQGKLRPHSDGEWVAYKDVVDEMKRLEAIVDAAWQVRREEWDYVNPPDLTLRAVCRRRLNQLLDARAATNKGAS